MTDSDGTPRVQERTRGSAFSVLLEEFRKIRREMVSEGPGKAVLTEELLREVFQEAWNHQFDEDRKIFQRKLRELVEDSVRMNSLDNEGEEEE